MHRTATFVLVAAVVAGCSGGSAQSATQSPGATPGSLPSTGVAPTPATTAAATTPPATVAPSVPPTTAAPQATARATGSFERNSVPAGSSHTTGGGTCLAAADGSWARFEVESVMDPNATYFVVVVGASPETPAGTSAAGGGTFTDSSIVAEADAAFGGTMTNNSATLSADLKQLTLTGDSATGRYKLEFDCT